MTSSLKALAKQGIDALGHSGVQPWSAGPIFPAVIAKVERYDEMPRNLFSGVLVPLADRLKTAWYELTLDGRTEQYATCEDAEMVAKRLLADPISRQRWNARRYAGLVDSDIVAPMGSVREHALYLAACERSIREGAAS